MKTIGLLGGMSWESSAEYYRQINQLTKERLGGMHSAQCVMYSVDFAPLEEMQRADRWDEATVVLVDAAQRVERAGADFLLMCTNTMHRMADEVQAAISIPLLHIADATAAAIKAARLTKVGLLGTRYTMEQDFYRGRLADTHGLEVITPDQADRTLVNDVIYGELVLGHIRPESRAAYRRIIEKLVGNGAQGIILGCTEIPMLMQADDAPVPVFDTTRIHAEQAVEMALA
jgi:aspartate racemase